MRGRGSGVLVAAAVDERVERAARVGAVMTACAVLALTVFAGPDVARGARAVSDTTVSGVAGNVVLASLDLGEGPGRIGIEEPAEGEPWGPTAFDLGDDGSIYVIDGASREIEQLGPDGEPVATLALPATVVCPIDVDVVGAAIYVLDTAAQPAAVHRLDMSGALERSWQIPQAYVDQWVTGIRIAEGSGQGRAEPDVLLEIQRAWEVPLLGRGSIQPVRPIPFTRQSDIVDIDPGRRAEFAATARNGRFRVALEKDWGTGTMASATSHVGGVRRARMDIVAGRLGALRFLDVDSNGDTHVYAEALTSGGPRAFVKSFDADGEPRTVCEIPVAERLCVPERDVRVTHDGDAVALVPRRGSVDVVLLQPAPRTDARLCEEEDVDPVVDPHPNARVPEGIGSSLGSLFTPEPAYGIWDRVDGYERALEYCYNRWWCSNYNYYPNGSNIRPRYITSYNRYWQSVPYCWGGWDLPSTFNYLMGQNRDAGDINATSAGKLYWTAGTDCSGLVSRLWGLGHKRCTSTQPYWGLGATDVSYYIGVPGAAGERMGDIYLKPGSHVMMVDYVTLGGARVFESTTWCGYDRVVNPIRAWAGLPGYYARRYNNWWR